MVYNNQGPPPPGDGGAGAVTYLGGTKRRRRHAFIDDEAEADEEDEEEQDQEAEDRELDSEEEENRVKKEKRGVNPQKSLQKSKCFKKFFKTLGASNRGLIPEVCPNIRISYVTTPRLVQQSAPPLNRNLFNLKEASGEVLSVTCPMKIA